MQCDEGFTRREGTTIRSSTETEPQVSRSRIDSRIQYKINDCTRKNVKTRRKKEREERRMDIDRHTWIPAIP